MNRRVRLTAAKAERKQEKIQAGLVSEVFPKVLQISISMLYRQTGVLEPLSRTVNFFPGSFAVFKVNCLCAECVEGGFDFTGIMKGMVKNHKTVSKGELSCESCAAPECAHVAYTVTVKYARTH
jgi:hypothetical protein